MIVEIDLSGEEPVARLLEADDFKGFKVVLRQAGAPPAERLAPFGIARFDEHAWVRVDALRGLAGASATAAWEESFAAMLEFARSRGWVDEELAAIRAHVERT